jgi:Rrf2 family nitric oxide-sensitive transcriptional repressor
MQLTMYTDYSLRVLAYLALHAERSVTISEVTDFYKISRNHLIKVVHNLAKKGFISTTRGKGGGIKLARPASEINVGAVVRETEPNFHIVECFNAESPNPCTILPICKLRGVLQEATQTFIATLDEYHISDLLRDGPAARAIKEIPIKQVS